MNKTRMTLLNTSVVSEYGTYTYKPLSLDEARELVRAFQQPGKTIQSAIGHESTAGLLSELLGFEVPVNRMEFKQSLDDVALVFKLKQRPPEGRILSRQELDAIGYEFGLLTRIS
ncbi:MAG TPA: YddF family protein [Blastocatellia bacterium]|nr:YddF family protein [Blastocatellia bacterium]